MQRLLDLKLKPFRLAVIGLKPNENRLLKKYQKKLGVDLNINYLFDIEKAKDRLVGKRI